MGRRAIHLSLDAQAAARRTEVKNYAQTPQSLQHTTPGPRTPLSGGLAFPDTLDESDLPRWKKEPPFVEDDDSMDPYSSPYLAFTQNLITVMHGVRLREQNTCDAQRRADFLEKGCDAAMEELREEVLSLLKRWENVTRLWREDFYHPYHNSREHAMLNHYRQWLARTIFTLYYLKFMD
ncbi:hypothetical protein B0H13DRAFT_1921095 [Mycena leptocephala]|nr:hypothetical protein B0H13DRAFT_1921095 [Mycena leptocephala]